MNFQDRLKIHEILTDRNAQIYAEWFDGKRMKQLAFDYGMHESSIKRALSQHRIDHNLPNGRKAGGD
jgi:Mor family transcriptional regulator